MTFEAQVSPGFLNLSPFLAYWDDPGFTDSPIDVSCSCFGLNVHLWWSFPVSAPIEPHAATASRVFHRILPADVVSFARFGC